MIHWLKHCRDFTAYESRMEPGLLLEGRPGTGKTLCSRYIATESNALFISVRDWPLNGDYVTTTDITELFDRSRRYYRETNRPVILFWDEFESYAQDRSHPGLSIRQQSVVSQLTAEMDGLNGKCEGLLFIGCTNYRDNIDPALLRAGRMGLHVHFTAPDRTGKTVLLKHYLSSFRVADDLDYDSAAYFFEEDSTAADIEEAAQTVWLKAVLRSINSNVMPVVDNSLIHDVLLKRLLGPAPAYMELRPETEQRVAIHELGHAIVAKSLGVPIKIITIQPGDLYFGKTFTHSVYDKVATLDDNFNSVCISLGSVTAEECIGIPFSAGIKTDTAVASHTALSLANAFGNDYAGLLSFDAYDVRNRSVLSPMSDALKHTYDNRAVEIVRTARNRARQAIEEVGRDAILELANRLVTQKTWTGPDFDRAFDDVLSMQRYDSDRLPNTVLYPGLDQSAIPCD